MKDKLDEYVKLSWLICQKHPTKDLYIYNYSRTTQYESKWDEITLSCRGLVMDGEGNIVSRCFPKFFNLSEVINKNLIPNLPFSIFPKMDGSYISLFNYQDEWIINSRGSFESPQSAWALEILQKEGFDCFEKENTYVFELIHPSNRIVVDYGDKKELSLLSIINNKTGEETFGQNVGRHIAVQPIINDFLINAVKNLGIDAIKSTIPSNTEGYVVRYSNGFRYKVKSDEYVERHKIVTNITSYDVWEWLRNGNSWEELLQQTPDDIDNWLHKIKDNINKDYCFIANQCFDLYYKLIKTTSNRKEFVQKISTHQLFSFLMNLYDLKFKSFVDLIYLTIKPKYEKCYGNNE